jgi:RimJ/RimL family protein N-acetyltransferase
LHQRGIAAHISQAPTPILALNGVESRRFFAKHRSNHKRKTNQLKQAGEVRLLQLTAESLTDEIFESFTTLCDIRYLARYGVSPFTDDPLKGVFYRRLLERAPGAVLFYALVAGTTPVAFNYNLADKRRAIFCMSPFDSRWSRCSPGKLIADLVAEALAERGMEEFDFTPGDDQYKQEVASRHETVHSIRVFSDSAKARVYDVRERLYGSMKRTALSMGVTREHAQRVRRLTARLKSHSWTELGAAAYQSVRRWVWSEDVFLVFRILPEAPGLADDKAQDSGPQIHEDTLEDFLWYAPTTPNLTRQDMMREAIRRIERGEHCYTAVDKGLLLQYGWVQMHPTVMHITEVGIDVHPPPNTMAMYDFYTDPRARGRGLYKRALRKVMNRAFASGIEQIMGGAVQPNRISHQAIQHATGFPPERRLVRLRRFGRHWKSEEMITVAEPDITQVSRGGFSQ